MAAQQEIACDISLQLGSLDKTRGSHFGGIVTAERISADNHEDVNASSGRLPFQFLQRLAWGFCRAIFATSVDAGAHEQNTGELAAPDPLVPLSFHDPLKAAYFAQATMISGAGLSAIACLTCAAFLGPQWAVLVCSARPLKLWLVVYLILQLSQIPIRVVFLRRLLSVECTTASGIQSCIAAVTASTAWRLCQSVSTLICGWLCIGAIWLSNSRGCASCAPCLFWTCIAVFSLALARIGFTFVLFRSLFPEEGMAEHSVRVGGERHEEVATPKMLDENIVLVRHTLGSAGGDTCAVCLDDYEEGAFLWELPCGHRFHRKCADHWLQRSKRCPLCMGTIDDTCIHRH